MHICFITSEFPKPGFPHGGVGTFVATLGKALVAQGVKVSVIGKNYISKEETETIDGINVYRLLPKNTKGLGWLLNAKSIARKIEEIHSETPIQIVETAEMGLAFLPKIKDIKYVIRLHGGHHFFAEAENRGINWWKGYQEKRSFRKADAFVAVSNYVKEHTEKFLSYHNKPLEYINNPINLEVFKPVKGEVVQHKIIFAGTVCEKKGIRQLIQAFPIVKAQFPDATLDVYGRDWLFPNGTSYIAMLKEKELPLLGNAAESVFFGGVIAVDKIADKYAEAEVCVFPSHMETLGLVAPEAMACGKAVIFTNRGPGAEVITNKVTGILVDPLNPEAIAAAIVWVFEHQKEALAMGKNAEDAVVKRFALSEAVEKNISFYKSLF